MTGNSRRQPLDTDPSQSPGERTVNLGGGRVVPYPEPKDEAATKVGKANRRSDTKPELRLRSALHRRGHRYRKDLLLRLDGVRVRPDVVFTRCKVAVFVDGCFWHGCPDHQHIPKSNHEYWVPKLAANVERDRTVNRALTSQGWRVVRIWEHSDLDVAVSAVEDALRQARALARPRGLTGTGLGAPGARWNSAPGSSDDRRGLTRGGREWP